MLLRKEAARYFLGLLLGSAMTGCSIERAEESLTLLQDVAEAASGRQDGSSRAPPLRDAIFYQADARGYEADLYRPSAAEPIAALVLVPGAAPDGKDDSRLVAFASALTRARFVVLVPEIANLRDLRVAPSDVTATADAVAHLSQRIGGNPVGLVAISYSAGPALIAATKQSLREKVGFFVAIGGYTDMVRLVTYFTTGYFRRSPTENWHHMEPNPLGKWLFLHSNLDRIESPLDRRLLENIARRKLSDPTANIGDLTTRLSEEGQSVVDLLTNEDPDRVPALLAALPPLIHEDMERLNPSRFDLNELSARLVYIHGRDDRVIPFTESQALDRSLAKAGIIDFYLVDNLAHVDLASPDLSDSLTLWRAAYRILEIRDSLPPLPPLTRGDLLLLIE